MSSLKCPGMERIRASFPDEAACRCGATVELWPDEFEARCPACGAAVAREAPPACVEWCAAARECVGEALHDRYMKHKKATS
ncbi:MAG: phosphohydrolase [bacterium]|nr:phosphohydrolase [bacterium]